MADWDEYSDGHPAWFAADGIHLTQLGATELATFVNQALVHTSRGEPLPAAPTRQ